MNISSSTPHDFSGLSPLTNSSLTELSQASFNETAAIITALGSSGGRTWDLKYYFIFCIPFLLTIPLFLVAGGVLRWAVYWRTAIFFVAPLIYVGFYWALPWYGGFAGSIAFIILDYGSFGSFAAYRLYGTLSRRRGRRVWGAFAFIVATSCVLDWLIRIPFGIPVFILFPWIFLLWMWIARERSS